MFIPKMPIVGKGSKKQKVWHHNGSLVGFFSSVHVLPDSKTAIVVLTNSLANNYCADWIGQFLLETVLDKPDPNDYLQLAKESADGYRKMWTSMKTELDQGWPPNTMTRPLQEYVGSYYNKFQNWHILVKLADDHTLTFKFQGITAQTYQLRHYSSDTFTWFLTPDESISRGR